MSLEGLMSMLRRARGASRTKPHREAVRGSETSPGAVDESRTIKPQIPLVGENGIPLHDEIRLELALDPVEAVKDA